MVNAVVRPLVSIAVGFLIGLLPLILASAISVASPVDIANRVTGAWERLGSEIKQRVSCEPDSDQRVRCGWAGFPPARK